MPLLSNPSKGKLIGILSPISSKETVTSANNILGRKDIIKVKNEMKKLGLQSKLYNPRIKRHEYFGKLYGSKKSPILALRESILDPAVEGVGRKHGGIVDINKLTRPL